MTTIQIVVWSVWSGFVLLMIAVSVFQLSRIRYRERGMRHWPHVPAVVVGHQEVPGLSEPGEISQLPSYLSVYRYTAADGQSFTGKTVWSAGRPLPESERLTVCVNPADPRESYPVERTSRVVLVSALGAMALFVIGSFFFVRVLVGS